MRRLFARPAAKRDEGFTLVEVILAMFIVVSIMTVVLGFLVSTLTTVAQARQRQSAAALATESLESLRALPYATVTAGSASGCNPALGLSPTSTYVTTSGSLKTFTPPANVIDVPVETLILNTQSPCARTVVQGATTYTVLQYVTKSSTSDGFNLTAVAQWTRQGGTAGTTVERSQTFSPAGCLLDTLHPFSGPCQAAFSARGASDGLSVTVTQLDPANPATANLVGSLTLPSAGSSLQVEQTVSLTSTAVGAAAQDAAGTGVVSDRVLEANSDPTSGSNRSYDEGYTISGGTLGPAPASFTSSSSNLNLAGSVTAGPTVCALPTPTGTAAISTGPAAELRPCGRATSVGPGNASASLSGESLLTADGITVRSGAAHIVGGTTAGVCGAAAPGCARSSAARAVASFEFLPGIPGGGLFSIASLQEFAAAEQGSGAGSPSTTRSGNLKVWNGTAHEPAVALDSSTSQTWSWGAAPSMFPAVTTPGGLTVTGSLTVTGAALSTSTPASCLESACLTTQRSGSISGSFVVASPSAGTYRIDIAIGGVSAVAGYQAAPVG